MILDEKLFEYKWKPSKTAKREFAQKMSEIDEFCEKNGINQSRTSDSYYFTLNGKNYRVSNHTVAASNKGAYDEFGNKVRDVYHPNGEEEGTIYITAGKTRLMDIYNDLKNGYKLDRRGNKIVDKDTGKYIVESKCQVKYKHLIEDTVKQNGKWVNKGKEGTHGTFRTKKEADAQRKAMFANGYKEELSEDKIADKSKEPRYFAKEVDGKGYVYDRKFSTKVPSNVDKDINIAKASVDKWNKEESDENNIAESFEDEHLGTSAETSVESTPQLGSDSGMATLLNSLIIDEWEAIQGYNDAIVTAETEGFSDIAKVLRDIVNEENLHIGQLEQCMKKLSPNAESIDQGKVEAEEQLNTTTETSEDPEEGMHY